MARRIPARPGAFVGRTVSTVVYIDAGNFTVSFTDGSELSVSGGVATWTDSGATSTVYYARVTTLSASVSDEFATAVDRDAFVTAFNAGLVTPVAFSTGSYTRDA